MTEHLAYDDVEWVSLQDSAEELTLAEQEIIRVTNELHSFADALTDPDLEEVSRAILFQKVTAEQQEDDLTDALRSGDYDNDTLEEFVTTLHRFAQEQNLYIWDALYQVPHQKLAELYNDSDSLVPEVVDNALAVGQQYEDSYADSIQLANHVLKGLYGPAYTWREKGEPREDLPTILQESIADKNFAKAALETVPLTESIDNPAKHISTMRKVQERLLADCIGMPGQIADIYKKSLYKRTMKQDDEGMPIPFPQAGAGIDTEIWYNAMLSAIEATETLSDEDLGLLYDDLGIVNYDRLTAGQVQEMLALLRGDKSVIEKFKSTDSALLFIDVDGDYNNAMGGDPEHFGKRVPTIFAELHSPGDIYRRTVNMHRKTGILPATIALSVHGSPGMMSVREKPRSFEYATWANGMLDNLTNRNKNRYDVRDAHGWSRFVQKYMQPHSQTGERTVLLLSCSQASAPKGGKTIPEVLVSKTKIDDNVRIRAPKIPSGVIENATGDLRFYDYDSRLYIPSYDARLAKSGKLAGKVIIERNIGSLL